MGKVWEEYQVGMEGTNTSSAKIECFSAVAFTFRLKLDANYCYRLKVTVISS